MSLRIVVAALMLITASALGMIAWQSTHPHTAARAPAAQAQGPVQPLTVGYLVAARALPAGTLTRDEDFSVKSVLRDQLPAGAIVDSPDAKLALRGSLITHYLDAGAPVTAEDVLRPRDRGFLAAVLEPGMRAVSVGVDQVTGVAGLISPGDRVDVILTQEMDASAAPLGRRVLSETVLNDVRVIAVDQDIVQGGSAAAGKVARTVTLQVTPEQAEKVAVAQRLGRLALSIRAVSGTADDPRLSTTFSSDVSPALSNATHPTAARVQVIEGDKRSEVTFQ